MATFTGTNNGYTAELVLKSGTQDKAGNYTPISYELTLKSTWNYFSLYPVGYRITLDGHQVAYRAASGHQESIGQNSSLKLTSGSTTIVHDSNGEKMFSVSFSVWTNDDESYLPGTISKTGSVKLATIPRASSITSVSNAIIGNKCQVKWTPASSTFKFKLRFDFGSWSDTTSFISPNSEKEFTYSYALPDSLANQIPKSTSGQVTVSLYTYSGSTQIGSTSSARLTAYVADGVIPSIGNVSTEIITENSVIAAWGIAISGFTKVKLVAQAEGSYGSEITSFNISGWYSASQTGESLSYTGPVVMSNGNSKFTITARDSRGRLSEAKEVDPIPFYAYTEPRITKFTVGRTASDVEKVSVLAEWNFTSLNGKNAATGTLEYRKSTDKSWTSYGQIENGTSVILNGSFSKINSYVFRIRVADSIGKVVQQESPVSTMKVLVAYRSGGNGIAFGKFSESDNFDVAMDAHFENPAIFDGIVTHKSGDFVSGHNTGTAGKSGYIRIMTISIKGTYVNTPIRFIIAQRGKPSYCLEILFANVSATDPDVDSFTYDGEYGNGYLVKSESGLWEVYVRKTEAYDSVSVLSLNYDGVYLNNVTIKIDGVTMSETIPESAINASPKNDVIGSVSMIGVATFHSDVTTNADGKEHKIIFDSGSGGTYTHKASLYGGNAGSPTAIGAWDNKNSRMIWSYYDATNEISIGSNSVVKVNGNAVATTIVESNLSFDDNVWGYKKYSDGTCDLWITSAISNIACNTAMGSWYRSVAITPPDFPFSLTNIRHVASFSMGSGGNSALAWNAGDGGGKTSPSYYLVRATSATVNGWLYIHVNGRWK